MAPPARQLALAERDPALAGTAPRPHFNILHSHLLSSSNLLNFIVEGSIMDTDEIKIC